MGGLAVRAVRDACCLLLPPGCEPERALLLKPVQQHGRVARMGYLSCLLQRML